MCGLNFLGFAAGHAPKGFSPRCTPVFTPRQRSFKFQVYCLASVQSIDNLKF
mgnify:FL=1